MTLNEKLYYQLYQFFDNDEARQRAANEIERWVLLEQLELLKNFYYGEDLKDDEILEFYKRVIEAAKKELTKRLNELNDISK